MPGCGRNNEELTMTNENFSFEEWHAFYLSMRLMMVNAHGAQGMK